LGGYDATINLAAAASSFGLSAIGNHIEFQNKTSGVDALYTGYGSPPGLVGAAMIVRSPWFLLLDWGDYSQTVFSNIALYSGNVPYSGVAPALAPLDLSGFDFPQVALVFRGPYGDFYGAEGSITSLQGGPAQNVPAPAALLLCGTSLTAICLRRSARRAIRRAHLRCSLSR